MDVSILCGGEGTRLRPLTYAVPKPMLPLGSKPILEVTIERLKEQGFQTFYLMVNYKAEMIHSYFGTGKNFGVNIKYFEERTPRGTAGPLSQLRGCVTSPFVVMNADLLTSIRFQDLMRFHKAKNADLTVALKRFDRKIVYGVVEIGPDSQITQLREKPTFSFLINSGIYVLSPSALSLIPTEGLFHMTELVESTIDKGMNILGYEFTEAWQDIGRMDDYLKIVSDLENGLESDTGGVFYER
jgi:NDP-sugar pyrophosphorylase family protein